ncbi:ATP synthase membrane subunit K, mitochondrial [Aricia agestis]|uniref:ATP synthase membrane subunit K, mitochondrial n=1 Tax=Aricia agestis TaxID=91739 RepID=UPI001C2072F3|nr:ATP synthase membrane subunit K, mitochondrial [Aricia agestis]
MAGVEDDPNLKGLKRYFNSETNRGRANVSELLMAGGDSVDESQLKGLSKYFNSATNKGRANTAKATYAVFGAIILYFTLKPKKK